MDGSEHGLTYTRELACCLVRSTTLPRGCLVDCEACMKKAMALRFDGDELRATACAVLELVTRAGANGIAKQDLVVSDQKTTLQIIFPD
jgi:hypothetical protein